MNLTLYSREGCHLCEEMLDGLKVWRSRFDFNVNIVDIDSSDRLIALYAARVPVLCYDETEICEYFLDEEALKQLFQTSHT